jgi:hypothetical protein
MAQILAVSGYIGIYNERLAIVLGFITLLFALATFVSCRSCVTLMGRLGWKNPTGSRIYRNFYRFHSYFWWGFLYALAFHLLSGLSHTGLPSAADPDSYLHVPIIWLGIGGLVVSMVIYFSCRAIVGILNLFRNRTVLTIKRYLFFYNYHAFYWIIFFLLIGAHFIVSYIHAGVWPQ